MDYYKGWNEGMSLEDTKNLAYWERNMLALKMADYSNRAYSEFLKIAAMEGHDIGNESLPCGWYKHEGEGFEGWSRVISLLDGKITFHVPDDFDLGHLPEIEPNWDGHSTEEKWLGIMKACGCQLPEGVNDSEDK